MLQSLSKRMKKFYKNEYGRYAINVASKAAPINDSKNDSHGVNEPSVCEDSVILAVDPVACKFRKASTLFRDELACSVTPSN